MMASIMNIDSISLTILKVETTETLYFIKIYCKIDRITL